MRHDRKKYYFFRDKDHRDNLVDGTDYHAAGIVMECYDPSPSGKDMTVKYIDPFNVLREIAWRSYKDVVLFEVDSVLQPRIPQQMGRSAPQPYTGIQAKEPQLAPCTDGKTGRRVP